MALEEEIKNSLKCLPLYNSGHCVSAFLGQVIVGDVKQAKIKVCFQFFLNEIVSLYSILVSSAKYFGGLEPTTKQITFLKKSSSSYSIEFSVKHLEGQEVKSIALRLEISNKVTCNLSFNEVDFGHLIEAFSIAIWHSLGLSQTELNIFLSYLDLSLAEFLTLKDFSKLTEFLKNNENTIVLAQLTRYHFPILLILHKLHNLYNQDGLSIQIREVLEMS